MNNKTLKRLFVFIFFLQLIPYLFLWDNAYVRIHDTLEGELNWYHMLVSSGTGVDFSYDAVIPQIMNGLPRFTTHTSLNFTYWFVYLFGTYWGYIFNKVVLLFIAFTGMYLFSRDALFKKGESGNILAIGLGVIYSWIPFYSVFGASFAGIPIVIWSFIKILNKKGKWYHYTILFVFPFYSSIVWSAPAILITFLIFTIYEWRNKSRFDVVPWMIMIAVSIGYLLANFQLLLTIVAPPLNFLSHRESYDFKLFQPFSIKSGIETFFYTLFLGQYHVGTFFSLLIWVVLLVYLWENKLDLIKKRLVQIIFLVVLFTGFYGLVIVLLADTISLVETFRFDRIQILLPLLYLTLFGLLLFKIQESASWRKMIPFFLIGQLLIGVGLNDEFIHNVRHLTGNDTKPNYKQYHDKALFDRIDEYIGKDKSSYRVINLGLSPSITQHNGYYTLDGLQAVYPLIYKEQFTEIIKNEISKDDELARYFNLWGNRCYLFSAELGKEDDAFMQSKNSNKTIQSLDINTSAIKELGGEYILSSVPIENYTTLNLKFEQSFTSNVSYWKVYLYSILE